MITPIEYSPEESEGDMQEETLHTVSGLRRATAVACSCWSPIIVVGQGAGETGDASTDPTDRP